MIKNPVLTAFMPTRRCCTQTACFMLPRRGAGWFPPARRFSFRCTTRPTGRREGSIAGRVDFLEDAADSRGVPDRRHQQSVRAAAGRRKLPRRGRRHVHRRREGVERPRPHALPRQGHDLRRHVSRWPHRNGLPDPEVGSELAAGILAREPDRAAEGLEASRDVAFRQFHRNPLNPDPKATVTWGDQTWQEMMGGFIQYTVEDPAGGKPAARMRGISGRSAGLSDAQLRTTRTWRQRRNGMCDPLGRKEEWRMPKRTGSRSGFCWYVASPPAPSSRRNSAARGRAAQAGPAARWGGRRGPRPRYADRRAARAARRWTVRLRHRRSPQDPRRRRDQGAVQSLEPRVSSRRQHAGHRAAEPASSDHPQRRARSAADRRRAEVAGAVARRADGRRAASALCREQADLPHLQQAGRQGTDCHGARAWPLGWHGVDRRAGSLRRRAVLERQRAAPARASRSAATACST